MMTLIMLGQTLRIVLILGIILVPQASQAVSLIAGIPNAETTEPGVFMAAHESQFALSSSPKPWTGFSFFTYGLVEHFELASTLFNLSSPASQRIAVSLGFKSVHELMKKGAFWEELRVFWGLEAPFAIQGNEGLGIWMFSGLSMRLPKLRTRFTAGPSFGTKQIFGVTTWSVMLGVEQPILPKFSLIADWFSGKNDLGALILAFQYDPTPKVTVIMGPKLPNDRSKSAVAWMIEVTAKI